MAFAALTGAGAFTGAAGLAASGLGAGFATSGVTFAALLLAALLFTIFVADFAAGLTPSTGHSTAFDVPFFPAGADLAGAFAARDAGALRVAGVFVVVLAKTGS